jgi:hypothetical protein
MVSGFFKELILLQWTLWLNRGQTLKFLILTGAMARESIGFEEAVYSILLPCLAFNWLAYFLHVRVGLLFDKVVRCPFWL